MTITTFHNSLLRVTGLCAILTLIALTSPRTGNADCCLTPPTPGKAPFHIRFSTPVHLGPHLRGQVSSEAPASYRAEVRILVGKQAVVTRELRGTSTTEYSPITVSVSVKQRRAVRIAARRAGRRAVLSVRVSGTLEGQSRPTAHARNFVMDIA
ncbi:MAG: hypothetical protein JWN32_1921 [Solirubrobacterales bacterium]|nr:hypothetical protein [Solirubrobacterales bacterium]